MALPTLSEVFDPAEEQLLIEALYRLRETKQEALTEVVKHAPGFTAWDFGIPQIDALLVRLDARPEPSGPTHPAASLASDEVEQLASALGVETFSEMPDCWGWTDEDSAGSIFRFPTDVDAMRDGIEAAFERWRSQSATPGAGFTDFVTESLEAEDRPSPR